MKTKDGILVKRLNQWVKPQEWVKAWRRRKAAASKTPSKAPSKPVERSK